MNHLKFSYDNALNFVGKQDILSYQKAIDSHFLAIRECTGKGNDFLGWTDLPFSVNEALITKIETAASRFREKSEVSVVVGIGGSYLGARAVTEALSPQFNLLKKKAGNPILLFAGNNISEDYLAELLQVLDEKDYTITVVSKSERLPSRRWLSGCFESTWRKNTVSPQARPENGLSPSPTRKRER